MTDGDFDVTETGTIKKVSDYEMRIAHLESLVQMGLEVVEDFLPNVGQCALQDYGRLNEFMIQATREKKNESSTTSA